MKRGYQDAQENQIKNLKSQRNQITKNKKLEMKCMWKELKRKYKNL
jgi:hypothetical protein